MEEDMEEIIEASLRESAYELAWVEGNQTHYVTPESLLPSHIKRLMKAARELVESDETHPFTLTAPPFRRIKMTALGASILQSLKLDISAILAYFHSHQFHPLIELAVKTAEKSKLFEFVEDVKIVVGDDAVEIAGLLNRFISDVRIVASETEFKKKVRHFERSSEENFREFNLYIDAHFAKRSRLLFLRLDLTYENAYLESVERDVNTVYKNMKLDWARLYSDLTRKIFKDNMLGYIRKLEYGLSKSFHMHVVIILNSSTLRADVSITKIVGDHWKNVITAGNGTYFNCNAKKKYFRFCGIGQIHRDDVVGRKNLSDRVGGYLTKPDYVVALKVPGGGRTFTKGVMPK